MLFRSRSKTTATLKLGKRFSVRRRGLTERFNGHIFVIHNVENGVQLGNLHHAFNFIRQVDELQFGALFSGAGERANLGPQAGAVDILNVS